MACFNAILSHTADGAVHKNVRREMKDIKAILEGLDIPDDAKQTIVKEVGENYRTINEVNSKAERIKELEAANKDLTETITGLEGNGEELESLKAKVAEFEQAEEDRKRQADEQAKRDSFKSVFDAAVGDKEFANDLIRETVFEKVYATCSQSSGLGATDVLDKTVENMEGVWKNPQTDPKSMPDGNTLSSKNDEGKSAEADKRLIRDFLYPKNKE